MNYYIQGDAANADKIRAAFERNGYDISWPGGCANPDVINIGVDRNGAKYVVAETSEYIKDIIKTHPDYKELELPVQPKFKVGDSLQSGSHFTKILSINLEEGRYYCDNRIISFENQDLWHLVPKPHYNISNFKPYQKVLIRFGNNDTWRADFLVILKKIEGVTLSALVMRTSSASPSTKTPSICLALLICQARNILTGKRERLWTAKI